MVRFEEGEKLPVFNGDRNRVQNLERGTDLWVRDCFLALCLLTFISRARTFYANHWHESENIWVLSKGSFQSRANIQDLPTPFFCLSSSWPQSLGMEQAMTVRSPRLRKSWSWKSASYSLWVLEWVACPLNLTKNLYLWMGLLEQMLGSMHQDYLILLKIQQVQIPQGSWFRKVEDELRATAPEPIKPYRCPPFMSHPPNGSERIQTSFLLHRLVIQAMVLEVWSPVSHEGLSESLRQNHVWISPLFLDLLLFSRWVMPDCLRPYELQMPGFPVLHYLLELAQTCVHQVSDAVQPFHPLSSPSPPALNLSQHQGLLKWVSSLHQLAKESSPTPQFKNIYSSF